MKKTIKSKKVFGVFVVLAIVLAGVFTTSYYVISSRAKDERPPSLSLTGKYQAFSKEGLQGFLKYEDSDKEAFDKKYGDTNKKSITLKEGINYVHVNKQTEIEDIIECIDPDAERILIAQYKPEDKVFYTFPKGPFGAETKEFASVHQKINPTEGLIVISRREAKAYCLKEPKAKAENKVNEPEYGGWTLVASKDDKVKDLVKDFEDRVKVAWVMEDDDSFKKAPDFETELEEYYLVWLKMDPKACVPEKEPHTVLMDYSHAIGNKDLAKLYKELPPSYQTALTDFVNKEVKEVLDNAKVDEIAPKVSGILKALAQSVNANFDKVLNVLPKDVIITQDKKDEIKTAIVDTLNFAASVADLLSKFATEDSINLEDILATDIPLLLAQAEAAADKIAAVESVSEADIKGLLDKAQEIPDKISKLVQIDPATKGELVLFAQEKIVKKIDGIKDILSATDIAKLEVKIEEVINKIKENLSQEEIDKIAELYIQIEGIATEISESKPDFDDYYSEYQKYLNVFKNVDVTTKDKQVEQATVTIELPLGDLPKELENSPEKYDEKMERIVEADGSCYWVPEGLPSTKNDIDTKLKPEMKKLADDLNKKFKLGMKEKVITSLTKIETGVQDFNKNGKVCELMGKSLKAYAEAIGSILDEEITVKVENISVNQGDPAKEIWKPAHMNGWQYIYGPIHGTYTQNPEKPEGEVKDYLPDAGYTGEDWILYSTKNLENDDGAILYCLNVN